eukprot:TRINITY_DN1412_c0_g1_i2.p1 TRINITY_DN1412_c0_g1~~TRINITY_DN1412_c0_g1_i2.p1  ORF type:complete len:218 (-),score=32.85 TRINITY_DN1412_c0_g1_i2:34-687(-)
MFEYAGPIIFYLLTYLRPSFLYGDVTTEMHPHQHIAFYCWTFHFLKRFLESAFVHIFSGDTLGLFFLFKNSSYYWGFGLFIGYFTNHPLYTPISNELLINIGLVIFVVSELGNGYIHLYLRSLRTSGGNGKARVMPKGFLYTITNVSFPNYFFEMMVWVAWNMMFFSFAGVLFFIAGTGQMLAWGIKKHKRYRRMFNGENGTEKYPSSRKAMIPFIL